MRITLAESSLRSSSAWENPCPGRGYPQVMEEKDEVAAWWVSRLSALTLVVAGGLLSVQAPADTVAYWRFEEGSGTSVSDSSGNGLDGTALGGLSYTGSTPSTILPQTGGANTSAMSFDGGAASRVFIADNPLFQLTESLTLEAYINMSAPPFPGHNAEILFRGDSRLGLDPYLLDVVNGILRFSIQDADNNGAFVSTAPPTLNEWVHVAGVLDNDTGAMSLYLDGVLVDSIITDVRPFAVLDPNLNAGLSIGGFPATDYFGPFRGMIDEVRISDTALSPDEFLNSVPPVPEPATASLLLMGVAGLFYRKRKAA